jgi:hypothetical protein
VLQALPGALDTFRWMRTGLATAIEAIKAAGAGLSSGTRGSSRKQRHGQQQQQQKHNVPPSLVSAACVVTVAMTRAPLWISSAVIRPPQHVGLCMCPSRYTPAPGHARCQPSLRETAFLPMLSSAVSSCYRCKAALLQLLGLLEHDVT